jgi:hypothetical protein
MSDYVDEPLPENEVVEEVVAVNAEVEEEPAPVEEPAPEEEPEPVEEPAEEPAEESAEEPAPANEVEVEEPVSTQEVVQNVQEMLTTEPAVSSDSARLEERVKVLEERLEKLIDSFKDWIGPDQSYDTNSLLKSLG